MIEFEVSGDKIQAVHMLPGYTHNIINLSETENLLTVMWANEILILSNGIFVSASEVYVIPAMEVARIAGINFYTDKRLWDTLANKRSFKTFCRNMA